MKENLCLISIPINLEPEWSPPAGLGKKNSPFWAPDGPFWAPAGEKTCSNANPDLEESHIVRPFTFYEGDAPWKQIFEAIFTMTLCFPMCIPGISQTRVPL